MNKIFNRYLLLSLLITLITPLYADKSADYADKSADYADKSAEKKLCE